MWNSKIYNLLCFLNLNSWNYISYNICYMFCECCMLSIKNFMYTCKRHKLDLYKWQWAKFFVYFSINFLLMSLGRQHVLFHFRASILYRNVTVFTEKLKTSTINMFKIQLLWFKYSFRFYLCSPSLNLAPNLKCFLFILFSRVMLGWSSHQVLWK